MQNSPLEKFKSKIKARNWSEFANKVIKEHKQILRPDIKVFFYLLLCENRVILRKVQFLFHKKERSLTQLV